MSRRANLGRLSEIRIEQRKIIEGIGEDGFHPPGRPCAYRS